MSINQLYCTWVQRIKELCPQERKTRVKNMALLLSGIAESRSVHLSKIANKIPLPPLNSSIVRRLSRFLDNPTVRVRRWYEPVVRRLLEPVQKHHDEFRLIVDGSKIGFNHQLLIVSIGWRGRALSLAWTWVKGTRGHSSVRVQLALAVVLLYVWLVSYGSYIIKTGQRHFVDRRDRRDLSLFRIGYDMVQRRLTISITFSLHFT